MFENGGTVRTSPQQIRRKTPGNGRIDLSGWLEGLTDAVAGESRVGIGSRRSYLPLRLVALRKSPEAAGRAIRQAVRESQRKGPAVREEHTLLRQVRDRPDQL